MGGNCCGFGADAIDMFPPSPTAGDEVISVWFLISGLVIVHGSICSKGFVVFVMVDVFARGGLGGGRSTEEFVLAGLLARSKLSPLTRCPGFKVVDVLEPKLGLRAAGPKI